MLTFGSLFAGVGGFDLGFERAGMACRWQVEINPQCRNVLGYHWPALDLHRGEDVRHVKTADFVRPDVICGGFPCQDLSVAGRRAGLAGERSGLFHEFMRIAAEFRPGWLVIENVPGLLSSDEGRDMGIILGTLGQLGYRWAYRVLDAQFFGVAQRRRRVFIVASAGDRPHPAEILFDAESLSRHPPSREETRPDVAGTIDAGTGVRRGAGQNPGTIVSHDVAPCIQERDAKGADSDCTKALVTHTLRAEGHDASEDGTGRGTPLVPVAYRTSGNSGVMEQGDRTAALNTATDPNQNIIGVPFAFHPTCARDGRGMPDHIAPALLSSEGGSRTDKRPHVAGCGMAVRRLTPRECERLQGFPEIKHLIEVDLCSGRQESFASVEIRSRKWREFVCRAGDGGSQQNASCAGLDSSSGHQSREPAAHADVHIFCGERTVEIRNRRGFHWSANIAESSKWSPLFTHHDGFARLIAGMSFSVDRAIQTGKVGSPRNERHLTPPQSGKLREKISGDATMRLVRDALTGSVTTGDQPTKSITSFLSSSPNSGSGWTTWFCSVLAAMVGCIPEETREENSLRLLIDVSHGWTRCGADGTEISDSARYRMLGNAVAVPVAEWIGKRLTEAN